MSTLNKRLTVLEQRDKTGKGLRIFFQDQDDRAVYREDATDTTWATEQIDMLASDGWQVIRVIYGSDTPPIKLRYRKLK